MERICKGEVSPADGFICTAEELKMIVDKAIMKGISNCERKSDSEGVQNVI